MRIKVGSKMVYKDVPPSHYFSSVYTPGGVYTVSEIAVSEMDRAPCFKFEEGDDNWITERFFELKEE